MTDAGEQLEMSIKTPRNDGDNYVDAFSQYEKGSEYNTFFCYCYTSKKYFVSMHFKKESIEKWYPDTVKIIK